MAYDGRLLRLAQERYEADRSAREADLAEQREQLYARRPRLREIQDQLRRTASRVMAAALRRGEDPLPEIQRLREENLSLQAERQMLLAELGLPDNALEDTPLCPFCNDTGYRGGEMCRCLKTYYVEEQRKELSKLLDLGSQSFDTFDTDWYSDQRAPGKTKSAREHMEWVYDTCVEYAHNFGKKPANLLLFGRPGWERPTCPPPSPARSAARASPWYMTRRGTFLSGSRRRNLAGTRQSGTWSGC